METEAHIEHIAEAQANPTPQIDSFTGPEAAVGYTAVGVLLAIAATLQWINRSRPRTQ